MTTALGIGLIGCGGIAQLVHLGVLTDLDGVRLVAIADPNPERWTDAARRAPGAARVASAEEIFRRTDVEAVVICAPNALHAELAIAAFAYGKHVYLEKPLATSLAQGEDVIHAWRRSGLVGMIGFNYRFNELHRRVKRLLQGSVIGDVVAVRTVFSSAARVIPDWKRRRGTGGGVLLDLASHHVDLLRFLLDTEIRAVTATVHSHRDEGDTAMVQLHIADGVVAQCLFTAGTIDEDRVEIYGSTGRVSVDRYHGFDVELVRPQRTGVATRLLRGVMSAARSPYLRQRLFAPTSEPSFAAALSHFAESVRMRRPASPTLWDGFASLGVIEAVEESHRTGCQVAVVTHTLDGVTCRVR